MTISYNTDSSLAGLGSFAVSITDNNGVPYPTGVTLNISQIYYQINYGTISTPSGFNIFFQTTTNTSQLSVGQAVYVTGTNSSAFNNNFYQIVALDAYGIHADISDNTLLASGTSTGTGSTYLTDSSASWTVNAYVGKTVFTGSSLGTIIANSSTSLSITSWASYPFGTPAPGQAYYIYDGSSTTGGLATLSYAPQTRTFPVDTSFEPYRREAFRHRSIPAQRNAIQMTNIMGEGTVNTEGLWRREMREFQDGAGQQYLDHKEGDSASRFYSSKGVDVFSYPYQAKLLPDTYFTYSSSASNLKVVSCNGKMVFVENATVKYVTSTMTNGSRWTTTTTITGLTGVSTIYDITAANSYIYIATDNGIWFAQPGTTSFTKFATGTYTMVAWANDQLIASNGPVLYAFQPRSSTTAPLFGSGPSNAVASQQISGIGNQGSALVQIAGPNNPFIVGQSITIANTQTQAFIGAISLSGNIVTATSTTGYPHGLQVGNSITLDLGFSGSGVSETATVLSVPDSTHFTWATKKVTSTVGFSSGTATSTTSLYNGTWNVSNISGSTVTIQLAGSTNPSNATYGAQTIGGSVGSNTAPDVLFTHQDPSWVWSDAIGGETQVYFAGYSSRNGSNGNGCVYRSGLVGSSTTSSTGTSTVSTSSVAQPFQLGSPVQALLMSPDEYPTALQSYLNFIFIGTNRGIRMAQTLSIYDPTATATGDLKAGPLIPNILTPVSNPVTAIVGDGRFVWF